MHNTICPYTCQPVSAIDASREHIIPDALGGPNEFALGADRACNSTYGEGVDSNLINSPLVSLSATRYGVETRSGEAQMRKRGVLTADASPVDVTFSKDEVKLRMRMPVVKDENGNLVAVRGFGYAAQAELQRLERDFKKKGRSVIAGEPTPLAPEVKVSLVHNHNHVQQGLAKIAYLATVWTVGDAFVNTSAGGLFRAYINSAPETDDLKAVGLAAVRVDDLKEAMPDMPGHYHVIICRRDGSQIATAIRLFGQDLLTRMFVVEAPELPASAPMTRILIVDSIEKTLEEAEYGIA